MVGLLIVVCVWGIQPAALEDIETLSPSLLLTDQELDIQTEMLVEQPEMHVSKTARAILDQFPYLPAPIAEEVHKNAAKPVATTYQSNNSLLKSNTDGDGSHDSSSRKHPSTEAEEDREFLIKSIVASLVVMIVFIILIISCFCKNNEDCCSSCDFTPGGATKPEDLINGSKPHNKRYLRKAPSMLRSSSYTV
jgi:hypothetical protein